MSGDRHRKRLENIRAYLALAGFQLIETTDGTLLICRWNLTSRPLADLDAVVAQARLMGVCVDAGA